MKVNEFEKLSDFVKEKRTNLSLWETQARDRQRLLDEAQDELAVAREGVIVFQKAAKISQESLARHLSNIVTKAIRAVIQKPYDFVCEFVEKRGATEADLYLVKDGDRFEILNGTGGGLADVCSAALKIAYLLLSNSSRVLVMDEMSRHINSPEQRERFAEVISTFSKQFDIQFILVTTVPELLAISDDIIELS